MISWYLQDALRILYVLEVVTKRKSCYNFVLKKCGHQYSKKIAALGSTDKKIISSIQITWRWSYIEYLSYPYKYKTCRIHDNFFLQQCYKYILTYIECKFKLRKKHIASNKTYICTQSWEHISTCLFV